MDPDMNRGGERRAYLLITVIVIVIALFMLLFGLPSYLFWLDEARAKASLDAARFRADAAALATRQTCPPTDKGAHP